MNKRFFWNAISAVGFCLFITGCLSGDDSGRFDEIAELRSEIRKLSQLKHDVVSLEKEVSEIRNLLQKTSAKEQPILAAAYSSDENEIDDPFMGPKDSELIVVAFTEYQCKPCRTFAAQTLPRLKDEFLKSDKIKFVLRDFPLGLHKYSLGAANLAQCGGEQGKYWDYHDAIFRQAEALDSGKFDEIIASVPGVDVERLDKCFKSGRYDQEVAKDLWAAKNLGVKGAPTFFVGRRKGDKQYQGVLIRGAQPYGVIRSEILKLMPK